MNSLVLHPTTQSEVEKLIKNLPNKSSSGHDKVINTLLKGLSSSISYPLTIIYNWSISQGIFQNFMKVAEVILLYKGKETDKVVNYHPISPLMTISKVLEKIVYARVYSFLETNGILYESQYGFRNKWSCEQAITELLGHILQAKEIGHSSATIFLDLSEAFDTLSHKVVLKNLDHYGIRGIMNNWFESYLSERSLKATVSVSSNKTVYSEKFNISYGTAQGSCLGPLLFTLSCNDIHLIPMYGQLILFADDTTLFNHH